MRFFDVYWGLALGIMAVIAVVIAVVTGRPHYIRYSEDNTTRPVAVLLIENEGRAARASAVHIGNGYFLTAHHVLSDDQTELTLLTNTEEQIEVNVLWSSIDYDISLLFSVDLDHETLSSYDIDCSPLTVGDELQFVGNPSDVDFASVWGRVSSERVNVPDMWESVIPVNANILPGMSGGPAIDENGNLRGVNVGTLTAVSGMSPFGPQVSFSGISYIVEAFDLCFLMGNR